MPKLSLLPKARKEYRMQLSDLRLKDDEMSATLGDGQGNVRIDQTHSWARVGESRTVMQVWNDKVPHIDDWEVIVGYEPGQNLFRVLRAREPYQDRPYSLFGEHGAAHSMFHPDGGHDITWIDIRQWLPWRVFPSSTFTVSVWYGIAYRNGAWSSNEVQTLDLSASQPADGALYVLITLDADGVLTATAGAGVVDKFSLADSDIPAVPEGHYPLAVVRLYDTQTEIQEQRDDTDIIDLRYPPYTTMAPASETGGITWQDVYIVAKSGASYTTIGGGYGPAVGTSTPSTILVAPGVYAESIPLQSSTKAAIVAMDHRHQVQVTPSSSSPINISDAANDVHIIDGLRLNPLSGQAAINVPSTGFGTFVARNCYIGANSGPSVSTTAAAATMDFSLENCYVAGDLNIKALTKLIDCDIAGSITQSAGAGNLTIDGGNIDGNLTHVTGSTITLRNLPRIAGTVSGTGTLVGPYIDSSGNIIGSLGGFSGFANPSGLIGMTAVNGVATTATRSDATHAIDPAIAPTWTGMHFWQRQAPDTAIRIGQNAAPPGSFQGAIEIVGSETEGIVIAEDNNTGVYIFVFTGAPRFRGISSGGTRASPSATPLNAVLIQWDTGGHNGTTFVTTNARIEARATELWSSTTLGSRWDVYAVPTGTTTVTKVASFTGEGQLQLPVTGAGAGLVIGTTTQLYESAANVLRTPDSLTVDVGLNVGSASGATTGQVRASGGYYHSTAVFAAAASNYHVLYEPAGNAAIYLGNATDPGNYYDNTNHVFRVRGGASEYARIVAGPIFFLGDTANASMTAGITINQGANDNEILSFKSSDVAHGVTAQAETDTYGFFRKIGGAVGGLDIWGFITGGANSALTLVGVVETADTAKTTGATGAFRIRGMLKSGTDVTNLGANANIAVFADLNTTRFILDADGDSHQDVGTAWTNFDTYNDVSLLEALSMSVVPDVRKEFAEWVEAQKPLLERLKLVTYNEDGHHFVNMSKLSMLLVGAVRQLASNTKQLESRIESLNRLPDRSGD